MKKVLSLFVLSALVLNTYISFASIDNNIPPGAEISIKKRVSEIKNSFGTTVKDILNEKKDAINKIRKEKQDEIQNIKTEINEEMKNTKTKIGEEAKDVKEEVIATPKTILIDNNELKCEVPPIIKSNTLLVPIRAVAEGLGANVLWDTPTKTVTVSKSMQSEVYGNSTTVIKIEVGSNKVLVNGKEVAIDVPAQIISNRTMVPIRFIAQALDKKVAWDAKTNTAIIY